MNNRMLLGWFVNYMPTSWNRPWSGSEPTDWMTGEFYLDMARALERASLDFIMLEDSSVVPENFGGSMDAEFKATTKSPKLDPIPLAAAMSQVTNDLGIITTMSTSMYAPDRLAHILANLDELTGGRTGWNVVTSFEDAAAQNVGLPQLWAHDDRYDRAAEYLDVTRRLWAGGANPVEYSGQYFDVSSPTGTRPVTNGSPLICQAGGSPKGMDFAVDQAEVIIATPHGIEGMKTYRDGIRSRLEARGKNPDSCRVLYLVTPILGETDREAELKAERMYAPDTDSLLRRLVMLSNISEIDFQAFDVDRPIPADATTNGAQSLLDGMKKATANSSLREVLTSGGDSQAIPLIGTPETVANRMEEALDEVGGDGFLLFGGGGGLLNRRYIDDVVDGLIPELQRRGASQRGYSKGSLRDRILDNSRR